MASMAMSVAPKKNPRLLIRNSSLIVLEVELILDIDAILHQIAAESGEGLKRRSVRRAAAASHRDVRIVDDEPVVVGAVETIIQREAEFFDEVPGLPSRWIKDPVAAGDLK